MKLVFSVAKCIDMLSETMAESDELRAAMKYNKEFMEEALPLSEPLKQDIRSLQLQVRSEGGAFNLYEH